MANWKNNTKNNYKVYLKQWENVCKNENFNTRITLKQGLIFLTYLFTNGNKYSSISSAQAVCQTCYHNIIEWNLESPNI